MDEAPDHAALFIQASQNLALGEGASRAAAENSGLFLRRNRSPEAEFSLSHAAKSFARHAVSAGGMYAFTFVDHEARKHDFRQWWDIVLRDTRPADATDDDIFLTAKEADDHALAFLELEDDMGLYDPPASPEQEAKVQEAYRQHQLAAKRLPPHG